MSRIGGLESEKGFTYPQLANRLSSVEVGDRLDKLRKGKPLLPNDEFSPIIGELYGLWFAKEGSHPWQKDKKTGKRKPSNKHKRDLIYSQMIVDLMKSGMTFEKALELHPAAFNGAQAGARKVTIEMKNQKRSPIKTDRKQRDERYRREKETIQTWFDMYAKQLEQSGLPPTRENLEQFIKDNL